MKQRTENRIWRGLFLAAIVGVGIAAGTAERDPKFVWARGAQTSQKLVCLTEDGQVYFWDSKTMAKLGGLQPLPE